MFLLALSADSISEGHGGKKTHVDIFLAGGDRRPRGSFVCVVARFTGEDRNVEEREDADDLIRVPKQQPQRGGARGAVDMTKRGVPEQLQFEAPLVSTELSSPDRLTS